MKRENEKIKKGGDFVAVLYNIRSLHNVGSIFRTADGAGITKIYLCGITPAPVDNFGRPRQQLMKTSLGAERFIKWQKENVIRNVLKELKKDGYKVLAVEQSKKSIPYFKFSGKSSKLCLVVGNEVNGLPPSILKLADKILEIPMKGAMVRQAHHPRHVGRGKESLNVSVAFGIVAYHISGIIKRWKK